MIPLCRETFNVCMSLCALYTRILITPAALQYTLRTPCIERGQSDLTALHITYFTHQ